MNRIILLVKLVCIASVLSAMQTFANPILDVPGIRVQAKSYILIDSLTGHTLTEYMSDVRMSPASLTKIMTLYLAAEKLVAGNITLEDSVKVSVKAWKTGGSRMFIEAGKQVSIGELIEGIAVVSGNDASVALAEAISGSEQAFVRLMNDKARDLGMDNTRFHNVSGLPGDNHYTTAHDMAILSKSLIATYPDFYTRYFSIRTFSYNGIDQVNRNTLLWTTRLNVDGIKTGHTEEAGYNLAVSARHQDMRLIAIILGAPSEAARTRDGEKLLRWGFRYFRPHQLYQPLVKVTTNKVWMGIKDSVVLGVTEPVDLVISKAKTHQISVRVQIPEYLKAPVNTGQQVGELVIYMGENEYSRYPLVALEHIEQAGIFSRIIDWIHIHLLQLFS